MPAGRPRGFDPEKALDAAICTFWKHGYEGASLEALTTAMGINRPSLYAAFGDKADLFEKAVRRYQATNVAAMGEALHAATDLDGAIEAYFAAVRRNVGGGNGPRGCLVASVLGEASEANPRWRALADELTGGGREAIAASLARFVPPPTAARAASLMTVATAGLAVLVRSGASADAIAEAFSVAIDAAKALAGTKAA